MVLLLTMTLLLTVAWLLAIGLLLLAVSHMMNLLLMVNCTTGVMRRAVSSGVLRSTGHVMRSPCHVMLDVVLSSLLDMVLPLLDVDDVLLWRGTGSRRQVYYGTNVDVLELVALLLLRYDVFHVVGVGARADLHPAVDLLLDQLLGLFWRVLGRGMC